MNWNRYWGWGLVALVLVLAVVIAVRPQPILVEIAEVKLAPMTVTIEEEGKTRVIDRFVISAPVAGYARRVELDVGDNVTQGQVLTELEPLRPDVLDPRRRAEAEARVAAARSALSASEEKATAAQADSERAQSEYKRKLKLQKDKYVTEEEVELLGAVVRRNEATLRSAKFSVDVARYELDAAGTQLQYSAASEDSTPIPQQTVAIRAPVAGAVLALHRESEGVVDAGSPLLEIGNPAGLEVAVDLLSFDAVRIKPGTQVVFEHWGGVPLEGIVRLVEPVGFTKVSALGVEEQRVLVIADITSSSEQWQRLGDNYRVEARFILWHENDVLQVPNASLLRHNDGWALFVVEDDVAHLRSVKLGQRNGLTAQILQGVAVGEQVVTHPDKNLVDGAGVRVRGG